ncbi:MAG TPA: hypothetical protein EYN07_08255 [Flavobacteriaceae bacterium]|nr:hypothetical protein [Flavobacteriaceae bacterium]HIN99214.1 hypothetical protein [Flavobacteriaceae bacterium]
MSKTLLRPITQAPFSLILLYVCIYIPWGFAMNYIGQLLEIAKFQNWWQVITCYGLYMIPVSLVLRKYSVFDQYCYGLLAMGLLEFAGYTLGTSYVYPNNILVQWFGPYTFALLMTLFFAAYFPLGNSLVKLIKNRIFTD